MSMCPTNEEMSQYLENENRRLRIQNDLARKSMDGARKVVEELERDLALNAGMSAKQCDMAREAESRVEELEEEAEKARRALEMAVHDLNLSERQIPATVRAYLARAEMEAESPPNV